ncbi:hypothetical protein [Actinomadura nitritigenes]|uniref:hypothetical protein n=1 Tax=Actinomadura nitritigenes TaxID=134602 RepID=UPI003D91C381
MYRYAVIKADLPPQVIEEMRRGHHVWNKLVEIEKRYEDAIAAIFASQPEIAEAQAVVADAEEQFTAASEAAAADRQRRQTRKNTPQIADEVKAARARLKAAREEVKRLKRQYTPDLKPRFREADQERNRALKATYAESSDRGLYWASYNEARSDFDAAVKRVKADRRSGKPAALRFRRWDGTGTIAVQLQRASGGRVQITFTVTRRPSGEESPPELPEPPVRIETEGDVKTTIKGLDIADGVRQYTAEIVNRDAEEAPVVWRADLAPLLEAAAYGHDAKADADGSGELRYVEDLADTSNPVAMLTWEGVLSAGEAYRGPSVLASTDGKWRNTARILPAKVLGDEDRRTVHQGWKSCWDGLIEMRIGSTAYRDDLGESVVEDVRTWLSSGGQVLLHRHSVTPELAGKAEKFLGFLAGHAEGCRSAGKTYLGISRASAIKKSELAPDEADTVIGVLVRAGKIRDTGSKLLLVGVTYQDHVRMPVVIHRELPEEADVCMLLLTRQRVGPHWKAFVSVVTDVPAPEPRTEGGLAALHIGWRRLEDGAIRAGVAVGIPAVTTMDRELRDWLRVHGTWAEVVVPAEWQQSWEYLDGIRSQRDRNVESLRGWLAERFKEHPWLREQLDPEGTMPRWRSASRFVSLAMSLWVRPDDGGPWKPAPAPEVDGADPEVWAKVVQHLEAWRRQDKHLWTWESSGRKKLIGRRLSAYRKIAAWLTRGAAMVAVDGWDIRQTTRAPRPESDENTVQAQKARANRAVASPGILRDSVKGAAASRGIRVSVPELAGPAVHSGCGGVFDPSDRAAGVMVCCPSCGKMVDQDVSSARALLDAAKAGG